MWAHLVKPEQIVRNDLQVTPNTQLVEQSATPRPHDKAITLRVISAEYLLIRKVLMVNRLFRFVAAL